MELEEQTKKWRLEQLKVASQVEVLPDENDDDAMVQTINERFKSVQFPKANTNQKIYYGGVDVSFPDTNSKTTTQQSTQDKTQDEDPSVAVYVILEYPSGKIVYQDYEYFTLQIPYIPSYLAFREIDPLERLIQKQLREQPDLKPKVILVDGNGIFHARNAGIACFVGVRTGIPAIGVGKTLYYEGDLNRTVVLQQLEESLAAAVKMLREHGPLQSAHDKTEWSTITTTTTTTTSSRDVVLFDHLSIPRATHKDGSNSNSFDVTVDENISAKIDRGDLVQELSQYCSGFAVPLAAKENGEILACALVGHGGRISGKASSSCGQVVGTKNPIYISVGHRISPQEAVRVCAAFSFAKIPEPVRQADLIGRELQRCKSQEQRSGDEGM